MADVHEVDAPLREGLEMVGAADGRFTAIGKKIQELLPSCMIEMYWVSRQK